jgi:hypothetical protein
MTKAKASTGERPPAVERAARRDSMRVRFWVVISVLACVGPALAADTVDQTAQDETEAGVSQQEGVSQEEIEAFKDAKKAAKKERVEEALQQDKTGNDPRVFANKWTPFYKQTELENGLTQQDLTAFGSLAFTPYVGMFYEVPLAQYRDFSDVPGLPPGVESDAIGVGDTSLKFLYRPKGWDFHYGQDGKKSGSFLFGTDMVLPTATDKALAGNALLFAPIVGVVIDMPVHGFFAMLNLYYFDVYKNDSAPETSLYVGRWFYMQPLTRPGTWWGGIFLMPEFQPIYDFETEDSSLWIGVELGKVLPGGKVAYVKPGWGISNSEPTDRKFSFEVGFRWFF